MALSGKQPQQASMLWRTDYMAITHHPFNDSPVHDPYKIPDFIAHKLSELSI